jgi:hypothetical protein
MVKSKLKVDKRIPIDFLSGFSAKLGCGIGSGKVKKIRGRNWTIRWAEAARLIGQEYLGKDVTLNCKLVVRGRIGNSNAVRDVILKEYSATINVPPPIKLSNFKLVNKGKAEITKVETAFPWATEIEAESGELNHFDTQFYFVELGKREAERDAVKAALRCAKGFMGSFDKTPGNKRKGPPDGKGKPDGKGPKRMLAGKKSSSSKTDDKKPAGDKKGAPKKMTNAERKELKDKMFKPKIEMPESRKLCNQVEVNDPVNKIP